jgi:hypothetical protein
MVDMNILLQIVEQTGVLNYERGAELDLKNAVNKTEPPIRSYSLAGNETVTEDLGQLGGEQLTIFGNGYEVDGNGKAGINVSNGQIVFVEKGIGEDFIWENFSKTSEGGAFYVYFRSYIKFRFKYKFLYKFINTLWWCYL